MIRSYPKVALATLFLIFCAAAPAQSADAPRVVVTIAPIHSLVAGVMEGVAEPKLLIVGGASAHSYSLRPSDARALSEARVVVWVSARLETFLQRAIENLARQAKVLTLAQVSGMMLHRPRDSGLWDTQEHHVLEGHDPHIWFDPRNAKRIAAAAAMTLRQAYPEHAGAFAANARKLSVRLDKLDADLRAATRPLKHKPYIVLHDAYRYFEARYGLNAVGAITVSPERPAGARRLSELRARIRSQDIACVFAAPQFQPKLVQTLIAGTGAQAGILDPMGASIAPGPELYFKLMRNLVGSLSACLKRSS